MSEQDYKIVLECLDHYINELISDTKFDPPRSVIKHLEEMQGMIKEVLFEDIKFTEIIPEQETVDIRPDIDNIIRAYVDASIKENPGGPASTGLVIKYWNDTPAIKLARPSRATTNNQAEYDAVYTAVDYFKTWKPPTGTSRIIITSDSQVVVKQLNGIWSCDKEELKKKRDIIIEEKEYIEYLYGILVSFEWKPRNSTEELREANYLAQDLLGVKRH